MLSGYGTGYDIALMGGGEDDIVGLFVAWMACGKLKHIPRDITP